MPALPSREMMDALRRSSERETRIAALTAAAQSWAGIATRGLRYKEVLFTARQFEEYIRGEK